MSVEAPCPRRPRRLLILVLAFVAMSLLASCQVDTDVDIAVRSDGSGVVTVTAVLDAAAAKRTPDLAQSLLVKDLAKTGWQVAGPDKVPGGGLEVSAAKPFRDAKELDAVIAQVAGADGPLRDFRLDRSHSFANTSFTLTGTVDLSGGLDAFGDAELRKALGGNMFGRPPAQLSSELGAPAADVFRFTLTSHLPGENAKKWSPKLGDPPVKISASSSQRSLDAWLFAAAALAAALGFVITVGLIARYNRIKAPPSYMHRPGGARRQWDDY